MITKRVHKSAAVTASTISRLLRENGFGKSDDFYIDISGSTVHVGYHNPPNETACHKELKVAQMREVLFELGYISSHPHAIYIECLRK